METKPLAWATGVTAVGVWLCWRLSAQEKKEKANLANHLFFRFSFLGGPCDERVDLSPCLVGI